MLLDEAVPEGFAVFVASGFGEQVEHLADADFLLRREADDRHQQAVDDRPVALAVHVWVVTCTARSSPPVSPSP